MEVGDDEKELLTVVLTVKNRKELLSETLRSISSQRALPGGMVTLVAVDNGSTDGAYNLLEYWVAYDAPEWLRV
ncbi:MAG: glycosyltransferase [Muribaculaceae bacterium]|nr:glycosyltransferase [Muribaculaceae bacterium]